MTDPCESIRPHCQLCHQLIHDVAYLTFGARTPATPLHQEEPAIWGLLHHLGRMRRLHGVASRVLSQ